MRPLRTLALAFALIAAAGLLFSTVGFSAAEIDRSIEIDIVDDESAAIGYEAHDPAPGNETNEESLLTVTNGLNSTVDVDITEDGTTEPVEDDIGGRPEEIDPGEKLEVEKTIDCKGEDRHGDYHMYVNVTASGDDVVVDFQETRQVTITCSS